MSKQNHSLIAELTAFTFSAWKYASIPSNIIDSHESISFWSNIGIYIKNFKNIGNSIGENFKNFSDDIALVLFNATTNSPIDQTFKSTTAITWCESVRAARNQGPCTCRRDLVGRRGRRRRRGATNRRRRRGGRPNHSCTSCHERSWCPAPAPAAPAAPSPAAAPPPTSRPSSHTGTSSPDLPRPNANKSHHQSTTRERGIASIEKGRSWCSLTWIAQRGELLEVCAQQDAVRLRFN